MDDYAYVNGKKLRKGFTTGTCATAATAAAISMILNQDIEEKVTVSTANGVEVTMDIKDPSFGELTASAAVEKDGGDDADATHGLLIYSTVTLLPDSNDIEIDGGEGVGRVTQKGLKCDVGMAAINPTPRAMIEKTAKLTYNSRLGIVGGISILGTTGIVNPMSEESWKASITIELTMLYNQGYRSVVLAPGNYGEDFATNVLGIPPHRIVNMSNFVGHVLKEVQRIGFTRVLMVGHMGKFVKVAGGIFSTHSKDSDARMEIIMANLALLGAPVELLEKVDQCITTDAAGTLIEEYHYEEVYQVLVDKMKFRSERLLRNRKPEVSIDVVTFGTEAGYLASTQTLEEIAEEWM